MFSLSSLFMAFSQQQDAGCNAFIIHLIELRGELRSLTYGKGHRREVTHTCNQLTIFGHQ